MSLDLEGLTDHNLRSDINKVRSVYSSRELSIDRNDDWMSIDYLTIFKSNEIKLIFAFNVNNLESTITIAIKSASSKNKHNLPQTAIDFITSMLMDKFQEKIGSRPIYKCIAFFDQEFATKNSKASPLKTVKEKRTIMKVKKEAKKREIKHKPKTPKDIEYIAFLRFNQLLDAKQHRKDNLILEQLTNLKHCSDHYFAYFLCGNPGIICICSTSNIIKTFAKTCNDIGKKGIISCIMNMRYIATNRVDVLKNDKYNDALLRILTQFRLKDKLKILDTILTGDKADFEMHSGKHKQKKSISSIANGVYVKDCKYEFNVEINYHSYPTKSGNLCITIFGENNNKLVNKHKFQVKKYCNSKFKFTFQSVEFLNKIGDLTKIHLENHGKESWHCGSVKISVYQIIGGKNKKNKKSAILRKEYEAKQVRAWIKTNSSLFVNFS